MSKRVLVLSKTVHLIACSKWTINNYFPPKSHITWAWMCVCTCLCVCVVCVCIYRMRINGHKRSEKKNEERKKLNKLRTRDENYDSVQPWIIPILNDFTQIYNILSINLLFVNSIFFFVDFFFFLLSFSSFVRLPNTKT